MSLQYVTDEGYITSDGYGLLNTTEAAHKLCQRHPGGRLHSWSRNVCRNHYTIEPSRPTPDAEDQEWERLRYSAATLTATCIGLKIISEHDAKVRGWFVAP